MADDACASSYMVISSSSAVRNTSTEMDSSHSFLALFFTITSDENKMYRNWLSLDYILPHAASAAHVITTLSSEDALYPAHCHQYLVGACLDRDSE